MSICRVSDSPARGGGWVSERKGPLLELVNRRYKRVLYAETDDIEDGPETVLSATGVPQIGSSYQLGNDEDDIAVCIDVQAEPHGEYPLLWKVTASYDSSRVVDEALSDPLKLPPEITWSFGKYSYPAQRDALGIPFVNSSGEKFDPVYEVELSRPHLVISRNESTYNETNAITYVDAVNSDNFGPATPWQAKIGSIQAQLMCDIGIAYWKVTYEIEFQARTFAYFLLDQGWRNANNELFYDPLTYTPLATQTLMNGQGWRLRDTYCALALDCGANDLVITVENPSGYSGPDQPFQYFPPGPTPGTPHWFFEIMVDQEIMQVTGGFGTNSWVVSRGYAGTTPATHAESAKVQLQPYFFRFMPYNVLPFAPLNLPINFASGLITVQDGGG